MPDNLICGKYAHQSLKFHMSVAIYKRSRNLANYFCQWRRGQIDCRIDYTMNIEKGSSSTKSGLRYFVDDTYSAIVASTKDGNCENVGLNSAVTAQCQLDNI